MFSINDKEKKYISIYNNIKNHILSKNLNANDKLPSKRDLSKRLGVSIVTVEQAYNILLEEGYIYSKNRVGYFVENLQFLPNSNNKSKNLNFLQPEIYKSSYVIDSWIKTIRKTLLEDRELLFSMSPNKGIYQLRNAISKYLLRYRGMLAQPNQIIIGSSSERFYEYITKLLGTNIVYAIENPSYEKIEFVYNSCGVKLDKLTIEENGISSVMLNKTNAKVLHVTPFHSYPTGYTATIEKRLEYLRWAKNNNAYIVEDDFDSEFFMPGNPIESLYSMDLCKNVIYLNTFSKSLSPSMKMGYMILPQHLLYIFDKKLGQYSCTVPMLEQYALTRFIDSGDFERHLNRRRKERRKA